MNEILEKLFAAADNHGEDAGEPDHTIGDLQDLMRRSWAIMSVSQRRQLLNSTEVADLAELGARDDFEPADLVAKINNSLAIMESVVAGAGYWFEVNESGFFWATEDEAGEDFYAREDAVADAHLHFLEAQKGAPASADLDLTAELKESLVEMESTLKTAGYLTEVDVMHPKVVVLCRNSEGEPEFHTCTPEVTNQQMLDGDHYDLAKENAANNGYEEPMIAFDKTDAAAKQLGDVLTWI